MALLIEELYWHYLYWGHSAGSLNNEGHAAGTSNNRGTLMAMWLLVIKHIVTFCPFSIEEWLAV